MSLHRIGDQLTGSGYGVAAHAQTLREHSRQCWGAKVPGMNR
jgi:hypothetical protein